MPSMLWVALAATGQATQFAQPVRFKAGDEFLRVESPGWACPSWHALDGDGELDLFGGDDVTLYHAAEGVSVAVAKE